MKKLFISQPMKGKSDEDILAERQKAIKSAEDAKSRIHVLLSMAFRLSKTTQQSRKEMILLSPIHGLNGICPV